MIESTEQECERNGQNGKYIKNRAFCLIRLQQIFFFSRYVCELDAAEKRKIINYKYHELRTILRSFEEANVRPFGMTHSHRMRNAQLFITYINIYTGYLIIT